jgi:carbamoyltransferase
LHSSHDASAALLCDGVVIAAIEKERLTRSKHDWGRERLDEMAAYCLAVAGIAMEDVACVVASEMNNLADEVVFTRDEVRITHHLAHAWAAVGLSGFDDCAVMVVDGEGSRVRELCDAERRVCRPDVDFFSEKESHYHYASGQMTPLMKHTSGRGHESKFSGTDGVGSPYWYLSQLIFGREHCESKVMGLAGYGRPQSRFMDICSLEDEGRTAISDDWIFTLGLPAQDLDGSFAPYADLAASVQVQLEAALLHKAAWLKQTTGAANLCFAGGAALNCVANSRLYRSGLFDHLHVPFGPGDSSVSIGCAFYGWHLLDSGSARSAARRVTAFLGKRYAETDVAAAAQPFVDHALVRLERSTRWMEAVVDAVLDGGVVAIFHGRSEFGPRALGNRSILGDPRNPRIRELLNRKVKFREPYRPFAASILDEHVDDWLDVVSPDSTFMQYVADVRPEKRSVIPGVVHVDGTTRVQRLRDGPDTVLPDIVRLFYAKTGVPLLLNTSFNVQEPIVETPTEALKTFAASGMDLLALEGCLVWQACDPVADITGDAGDYVLIWHQDIELAFHPAHNRYELSVTGGREEYSYQGWHRTVAARAPMAISVDTFNLLTELRPRRDQLIAMGALAPRWSAAVRADFERLIARDRVASLLRRRSLPHDS